MAVKSAWASLDGTGLHAAKIELGIERAEQARSDVVRAAFALELDEGAALPERTAAKRVVVLGIGGSALGARCVHDATFDGSQRPIEVVDNIDPEAFERVWRGGDPAQTAWVVISKSGGTTETLAQCALLRSRLKDAKLNLPIHLVTGAAGALRELGEVEGYPLYSVPESVGGRFSVFTPAATVPLALAGHDVRALLDGARAVREDPALAARLAAFLIAGSEAGRNVVALWSYAERLEAMGEWFRQLWAESLGKVRADGVRVGQSPLHCVGSTDQHSMQQLMVEGPRDKIAIVLAGPPTGNAIVPSSEAGAGAGHAMSAILDAMRRATTYGMVRAGTPTVTLQLESWGERDIGELLMLFMAATVYGGALLDVDCYGQPGVEAAKVATNELLTDPDGEGAREIRTLLGEESS